MCAVAPALVRLKFIKPSGPSADLGPCFYVAAPTTTITSLVHRPAIVIIIINALRAPLIDQRNNHFRHCNETVYSRCSTHTNSRVSTTTAYILYKHKIICNDYDGNMYIIVRQLCMLYCKIIF